MRAGKLRHRIVIEYPIKSQTTTGAVSESWQTFATLWAELNPKQGIEVMKSGQMFEFLDIVFGIRYYPDLKPEMRVMYESRYFDIKSVINDMHGYKKIYIGAKEIGNVGIVGNAFTSEFTTEFA